MRKFITLPIGKNVTLYQDWCSPGLAASYTGEANFDGQDHLINIQFLFWIIEIHW